MGQVPLEASGDLDVRAQGDGRASSRGSPMTVWPGPEVMPACGF